MKKKIKTNLGGRELIANIEDIVEQSNGSVFLQYGDTVVLTTATMEEAREGIDYFPLLVDYRERFYADGKIMGSRYTRREGKPSSREICHGRLIDRAIRPLFPKELKKSVQIINTVVSFDEENDPSVLGLIASSIAIATSDIPWNGPVAAIRVGKIGKNYILNPTYEEREKSDLDIVFSAAEFDGKILLNMIEGESKEVSNKTITKAYSLAKQHLKKILNFQKKIIKKIGKEKIELEKENKVEEVEDEFREIVGDKLEKALYTKDKEKRNENIEKVKEEVRESINKEENPEELELVKDFFEKEINKIVHRDILAGKNRIDGRELDEVRDINCRVGFLPRTHGSGLFQRGKTKALSVLTLGSPGDAKLIETIEFDGKKRFMHFYNFPPFSVGETNYLRAPGRREIGHGLLAEGALRPVLPKAEDFPYTIRIVSEILSSNGSTSQASISGSSLALMDAGVPVKRHVTGIALGLITNEKRDYKILTDIQGPEDHFGDMDFKVAGTEKGITAIQMDIKIKGITEEIMKKALKRAKKARMEILEEMNKTIPKPRKSLSPLAPRIISLKIPEEKIGTLIGPKGETINEIIDDFDVKIDVEEDGTVFLTAKNKEDARKASEYIKKITREVKVGDVYKGEVKKIMNFGAFVEILPGTEGLLHISKLSKKRVEKVEDVVNKGDVVKVKVISVDKDKGEIDLSLIKK